MRPFYKFSNTVKSEKCCQAFKYLLSTLKGTFMMFLCCSFKFKFQLEKTKGTKNCYSKGLQNKQLPPNGSRSHPSIPLTLPPQSLSSLRASISQLFYLPTIKSLKSPAA